MMKYFVYFMMVISVCGQCKFNGSFAYTTNNQAHVKLGVNTIVNSLSGARGVTLSAWIKSDFANMTGGGNDSFTLIASYTATNLISVNLSMQASKTFRFYVLTSAESYAGISCYGPVLPSNVWTHIAGVANFDAGTVSTYVNGLVVSNRSVSYTTNRLTVVAGTTYPDYICSTYYNASQSVYPYRGSVEDLRIYDRALTPLELYDSYSTGACDPVLPYRFFVADGNTGDAILGGIAHNSGTGPDGTFIVTTVTNPITVISHKFLIQGDEVL